MSLTPVKRKLAAILAADAVGYSRLMSADEEGTMRILAAHRAMIDGIIELQEGRIVNTAGDSVLAEFESPVQAVRCAVEIQDALRTRNDALPEDKRLVFRIGVNLGDVMVKGDDLLGDGVNVAARLESVADPGGICVSSSVYDQIAGKLDLGFVDVGHKALKNIDRPVRVYRIDRNGRSGTTSERRTPPAAKWVLGLLVLMVAVAGVWHFVVVPMQDAARLAEIAVTARAADEERRRRAAEEREREVVAQRHAETEATLAKQLAVAETARRRAEAQTRAAADEKLALEKQRVADEHARVEAELVQLRSEAQDAKRKAAAELAAAAAARRAAENIAPARTVVSAPMLAAGVWQAEIDCPQHRALPPRTLSMPVSPAGGEYLITEGVSGKPGHLALRGTVNADRSVTFLGTGISGRRAGSRPYEAAFTVRPVDARYEGKGKLGSRECKLALDRK